MVLQVLAKAVLQSSWVNISCCPFYQLHASTAGNAEIKKIMDTAKKNGNPPIILSMRSTGLPRYSRIYWLDVVDRKVRKNSRSFY